MGRSTTRKAAAPAKKVCSAPSRDKYKPRAMDHLLARVIQDEDEYQASLSQAAKDTDDALRREDERNQRLSAPASTDDSSESDAPPSPPKRRAFRDEPYVSNLTLTDAFCPPVPPSLQLGAQRRFPISSSPAKKRHNKPAPKPSSKVIKPAARPVTKKAAKPQSRPERRIKQHVTPIIVISSDEDDSDHEQKSRRKY
ncbi:hypothetical protein F4778DRAFT_238326 [Xylariomycetidae sp. FL2044]|nr:hypothetical protein F4778DRAFT_238326 [Xylariomycetidae sp. FL2044]